MDRRGIRDYFATFVSSIRVEYYRFMGVTIGKNCMISFGAKLDCGGGKMIIGDGCTITHGCIILAHDRAKRIINRKTNPRYETKGTVRLGNNVFVGVNSVILRDVTIGDDSIIGAGSVVTKDVPPNVVVAGNPAKIIREFSSGRSLV